VNVNVQRPFGIGSYWSWLCVEDVSDWIGLGAMEELDSEAAMLACVSSHPAGRESAMMDAISWRALTRWMAHKR
jgi:hypothetical protein